MPNVTWKMPKQQKLHMLPTQVWIKNLSKDLLMNWKWRKETQNVQTKARILKNFLIIIRQIFLNYHVLKTIPKNLDLTKILNFVYN